MIYLFVGLLIALDSAAKNPLAGTVTKGTEFNGYLAALGPVVWVTVGMYVCFKVMTDDHTTFRDYQKQLWAALGFGAVPVLAAYLF